MLDYKTAFQVTAPEDHVAFVTELAILLPDEVTLLLEGVTIHRKVAKFLSSHQSPCRLKIARATIWPPSRIYHVEFTSEVVEQLADCFASLNPREICDHFHAYAEEQVLLEWHDAFGNNPLLLSSKISEERIRDFCSALGCSYGEVEVPNS